MKGIRALGLLLESIVCLLSLQVQSKIRKVRSVLTKKQKEKQSLSSAASAPGTSQAPTLNLQVNSKARAGRPIPSFPAQKKSSPAESPIKSERAGSIIGVSSADGEISQRDVRTAGAALDLPFRAVNLIWKDVPALSKEEIEYMAEPLAEILIELDWMDKLKGPYLKFGWGLSIAVVSRFRAHELLKAEKKKDLEKKGSQDRAGGANVTGAKVDDGGKKAGGTMEPGRE